MSDSEIPVEVPVTCSRTNKTVRIGLPLEEVGAFVARRAAKAANAKRLLEFLAEMPENERPDLIAIYKGRGGIHANVNMKSDSIVGRAFNEALNDDEAFDLPDAKPRKPRGSKTAPTAPALGAAAGESADGATDAADDSSDEEA